MIRITISAEAFAAIERTLPIGNVGVEREATDKGERQIWIDKGGDPPAAPYARA